MARRVKTIYFTYYSVFLSGRENPYSTNIYYDTEERLGTKIPHVNATQTDLLRTNPSFFSRVVN